MEKLGLHSLSLVYPPISNQEAEWLWDDPDVRRETAESKLYMIGQRREVFFENFSMDHETFVLKFDLVSAGNSIRGVAVRLKQFKIPPDEAYGLELGPKLVRIYRGKPGTPMKANELAQWFTPFSLFHQYVRGHIKVEGLEGFRKFTEFTLYYVGISKKGDSYSRLFKTAHEKRSRILGNETQQRPAARLTDELTIFLFKVEDLQVIRYSAEDIDDDFEEPEPISQDVLAADAEKAFIRITQGKYNEQVYPSYPKSSDGLWGAGFKRYGFFINELITFHTDTATIRGARHFDIGSKDRDGDFIMIEGETVRLLSPPHYGEATE